MRKFLFWHLPLVTSLVAGILFVAGFYSFLRGDTGKPVDWMPGRRAAAPVAPPPRATIVPIIVGDSLARGAGDESGMGIAGRLDQELRQRKVKAQETTNIAINGARTNDLIQQLESRNVRTLLAQSNVIVVSIGGNDLWGGTDWRNAPPTDPDAVMDQVLERIDKIVKTIRAQNKTARIFVIGLYNPFISAPYGRQITGLVNRWNGKLLERFGGDGNITVVATSDLFSHRDRLSIDRFHPSGEGYGLIARRIAESL
jgi:lysophospholipase L1-like esterase